MKIKNDIKCMGKHWRKWKVAPPILNSFEELEFNQSVSWSKDRKQSEDVQIIIKLQIGKIYFRLNFPFLMLQISIDMSMPN